MKIEHWICHLTFPNRYFEYGHVQSALDYCQQLGKIHLYIIDIGCSTGVAARGMKLRLSEKGIASFVKGIDIDQAVEKEAKVNLDGFELGNIIEMGGPQQKADVTICNSVATYVKARQRAKIIQACSKFMKDDGILLTNAGIFSMPDMAWNLKELEYALRLRILRMHPHFSPSLKTMEQQIIEHHLKKLIVVQGPEECIRLAEAVTDSWEKLNALGKFLWNSMLLREHIDANLRRIFRNH